MLTPLKFLNGKENRSFEKICNNILIFISWIISKETWLRKTRDKEVKSGENIPKFAISFFILGEVII